MTLTDSGVLASDFDSIQSEEIKHVWYFQPISFVNTTLISAWVCCDRNNFMIFSRLVYDAQFSFVTIYNVGKCMIPSVLQICSDFKSRVVYSSLNAFLKTSSSLQSFIHIKTWISENEKSVNIASHWWVTSVSLLLILVLITVTFNFNLTRLTHLTHE